MQRLINFFKKDAVNNSESNTDENNSFVSVKSESLEYEEPTSPADEVKQDDTEAGETMTFPAAQPENDNRTSIDSEQLQKQEEKPDEQQQAKQEDKKQETREQKPEQKMELTETEVVSSSACNNQKQQPEEQQTSLIESKNEVAMLDKTAAAEELITPQGDVVNPGTISEDAQTAATVSTGSGSGSSSSGGGGGGVGGGGVGGGGNLGGNNKRNWETKTKIGKVSEKGDLPVKTSCKESGGRMAPKTAAKPDVIHPLQNSWGIWCFMQNRSQDWHENVRHISNFSSVEDFWSLFNHIQTVDNLPIGCDYYIFKASIQPMWEDRANVNGGRWLLKVPHSHPTFVQLWIETLLLLVGEAFDADSDSVCGAVAQVRRGFNKISIWTRDAANRGACMRIGYRWKSCLKLAAPIHYEAHLEVNRKGGRRSKSVYSIN